MNPPQRLPLDLAPAPETPAAYGPDYWRSLEELAGAKTFQQAPDAPSRGVDRRRFLSLLGASLGLAGLTGCFNRPRELILPYIRQPEGMTPGNPLYFATAMPLAGYGSGLLIKSVTGRPIKAEGNPDHPASQKPTGAPPAAEFGPTDLFAQASLYTLYDPDRSQSVTNAGSIRSWDACIQDIHARLRPNGATNVNQNLRISILTETVTSPSVRAGILAILDRFSHAKWHLYDPVGQSNSAIGLHHAFGSPEKAVRYQMDRARVILALDADFLACGPGNLRYARDFASRRQATVSRDDMNRLYVVESMPSVTGTKADHRLPLRAGQILSFARAVAEAVGVTGLPNQGGEIDAGVPAAWINALADDLKGNRGAGLVIAGDGQPPLVHALAAAMNDALGNVGANKPVVYSLAVEARRTGTQSDVASLQELVDDLNGERVDILVILSGNPVYTAPADFRFDEALQRAQFRIHLSQYNDETSELCHWHIPEAHYLESWGDVRAFDGTVSIIQPLIAPLFGAKTAQEVLALFTAEAGGSSYELVRNYWARVFTAMGSDQQFLPDMDLPAGPPHFSPAFETWWRETLHRGVMERTAVLPHSVTLQGTWAQAPAGPSGGQDLEIVFKTDPTIFDGRFANNGWLQELPKPISKLTWDNAAYLSPATAVRLGFAAEGHPEQANEKVVTLHYQGRSVEAPLLVLPGHADDCITVHLGFGRTRAGHVGNGVGFNAYLLRSSQAPWFDRGLTVQATGRTHALAFRQHHFHMEGRDLVRAGTAAHPPHISDEAKPDHEFTTLYAADHNPTQSDKRWGMGIDLTACTGCSACVVACQSENNIPVVGKAQVRAERIMHWLRVDTYYQGPPENPETFNQPVPCQQCEHAPCELVCPVEATSHSEDGLNDMTYNRCVGTRYCSNNCPYKVRRFNFFQYADIHTQPLVLMYNPEVTVRSRGVMEKCTYCVQRIRRGEVVAAREDRPLRDGEIMTACQAACPAGAITFGDLNQNSRVKDLRQNELTYGLLNDLNTRPRTSYLASLKNPNPALAPGAGGQHHD